MSTAYVEFPLQGGYLCDWLTAGPQASEIEDAGNGTDVNLDHPNWSDADDAWIGATAVERGPVDAGRFVIGEFHGAWVYTACGEDRRIDLSRHYATKQRLRAWAYTEVVSSADRQVGVTLWADGPVVVWAGDTCVARTSAARDGIQPHRFTLSLSAGATPLLVRFEQVGMRHTAHTLAVRLAALDGGDSGQAVGDGVSARVPTLIPNIPRRNAFAKLSTDAYMDRDVYVGETPITLCWPDAPRASCFAHVRLQTPDSRIYALGDSTGGAGEFLQLSHPMAIPAGPLQALVMPDPNEVFLQHIRVFRTLPLWSMGRQRYRHAPNSELSVRRNEALLAVAHGQDALYAQIARMAWGAWADVDGAALEPAIDRVRAHQDGSHLALLALLGMQLRWSEHPHFPPQLRSPLEAAVLSYRYWREDIGHDVMDFNAHANPLVYHTCEVLAGRIYADRIFADGQSGRWHAERGSRLATAWMASYGSYGAVDWNSPLALEHAVAALTHLCDLAEDEHVYELAAVTLDKLLFGLAVNSTRGVFGAATASLGAGMVKSGLLLPTAGIADLLWGMGIVNHHVLGVLSLACCSSYQLPTLLQAIAQDMPDEVWSREQHAAPGTRAANVVTYKTPDGLLSSVQDYRAGERGASEQVWRATLSPTAVVFTNHPGSSSESDSRSPGYWHGNGRLPRVAQWQDALVAIYQLEEDDLFEFTHAYFPTAEFDEYALHDGWAFARCGEGYLALKNTQGMTITESGPYARREIRAYGRTQTWLVQMGRQARDGDFAAYQARMTAQPLELRDRGVRYTTLAGDVVEFAATGPLRVNGEVRVLESFPQVENRYGRADLPAQVLEIHHGSEGLRLDFTTA